MSGNQREHRADKGWWDGGSKAHGSSKESAGQVSSYPGRRQPSRFGVRIELDRPMPKRRSDEPGRND
jgi:hypothetical protein